MERGKLRGITISVIQCQIQERKLLWMPRRFSFNRDVLCRAVISNVITWVLPMSANHVEWSIVLPSMTSISAPNFYQATSHALNRLLFVSCGAVIFYISKPFYSLLWIAKRIRITITMPSHSPHSVHRSSHSMHRKYLKDLKGECRTNPTNVNDNFVNEIWVRSGVTCAANYSPATEL